MKGRGQKGRLREDDGRGQRAVEEGVVRVLREDAMIHGKILFMKTITV